MGKLKDAADAVIYLLHTPDRWTPEHYEAVAALRAAVEASDCRPAPAAPMKFNINEIVRAKLTPLGVDIYRAYYGNRIVPGVDADGYTEFPLWSLMAIFGPYVGLARDVPFEITIEIPGP